MHPIALDKLLRTNHTELGNDNSIHKISWNRLRISFKLLNVGVATM